MRETEFISSGFRVIGVWLLIILFGNFAEAFGLYQKLISDGYDGLMIPLVLFMPCILGGLIAFLLLFIPVKITKFILPKSRNDHSIIELNNSTLCISLLTVLGFYTVSTGLSDLAFNWMTMLNYDKYDMSESFEYGETFAYQVSTVIQISIGTYFIFGSKKLYKKLFNSDLGEVNT